MNRSLMIMAIIGVLGMVMLSVFGSFLVGKVGSAESLTDLRKDIAGIFGSLMADPERLDVTVRREGRDFGVFVRYPPHEGIADRDQALEYQSRRIAEFVMSRKAFRRHAFVVVELEMPKGRIRATRFERAPAPAESSSGERPGPGSAPE